MSGIACRNVRYCQRPCNTETRIPWIQAILCASRVRLRMAIQQLHIVAQGLEAVGKALWNEQGATVFSRKAFCVPVQKGGRSGSHIDHYIPNFAANATDQFHLGVRWSLEMQSANSALLGSEGVVDLDYRFLPAGGGKFFPAKQARQKTAGVADALAGDAFQAGQWQFGNGKAAHSTDS